MRGDGDRGLMSALRRLARALGAWRQDRAARRRAKAHGFMGLSDRALADIGVRRADVVGAAIGAMPLRQSAATAAPSPRDAQLYEPPRRPTLTVVTNDLGAAA
jgi:uncharacterized protein YjiS (DUF1127 family)